MPSRAPTRPRTAENTMATIALTCSTARGGQERTGRRAGRVEANRAGEHDRAAPETETGETAETGNDGRLGENDRHHLNRPGAHRPQQTTSR